MTSTINWIRNSAENVQYGEGQVSNAGYLAERGADAAKLFTAMMGCAEKYDWPTAAGSNICTVFDLGYCRVTENKFHDYLPAYELVVKRTGTEEPERLHSDDFIDIMAEILRRWW